MLHRRQGPMLDLCMLKDLIMPNHLATPLGLLILVQPVQVPRIRTMHHMIPMEMNLHVIIPQERAQEWTLETQGWTPDPTPGQLSLDHTRSQNLELIPEI